MRPGVQEVVPVQCLLQEGQEPRGPVVEGLAAPQDGPSEMGRRLHPGADQEDLFPLLLLGEAQPLGQYLPGLPSSPPSQQTRVPAQLHIAVPAMPEPPARKGGIRHHLPDHLLRPPEPPGGRLIGPQVGVLLQQRGEVLYGKLFPFQRHLPPAIGSLGAQRLLSVAMEHIEDQTLHQGHIFRLHHVLERPPLFSRLSPGFGQLPFPGRLLPEATAQGAVGVDCGLVGAADGDGELPIGVKPIGEPEVHEGPLASPMGVKLHRQPEHQTYCHHHPKHDSPRLGNGYKPV